MQLMHIENIGRAVRDLEDIKQAAKNEGANAIALDAGHVLAGLLTLRSRIFGMMQQVDAAKAQEGHAELAEKREEAQTT